MRSQLKWETEKLGEIALFKTGKLDSNAAVSEGKYPFFTCSQETLKTNTFSFDTECVLLAGNNAAGIFPLKYFKGKFDAYQRTYIITPRNSERLNVRFLYYALRPKLAEFRSVSTGAATKFLTLGILNETLIQIPPLKTQCRIAAVLGAYDDLIEVNRKRISVLEKMARGLFAEWFTRMRFPGHENVAIESTPDGPLPTGWHRAKVGEVLKKIKRPIKIQKQEYIATGSVPCIDQGANFIGGYTDNQEAVIASPLPMCVFGDHTRILKFVTFPFASGADGTQLLYPTDELTPVYLYLALIDVDLSNQHYARHFKFLKEQILLVPPRAIVECFSRFATPIFDAIQNYRFQSEKLDAARDLLLSRLISGQLSVTQAERELEGA